MPTAWWWFRASGFLAAATLAFAIPAEASDARDVRRVAAEVRVMLGDLDQLQRAETSPAHRLGLTARLNGSLSFLRILVRQARGATGTTARPVPVEAMRQALADGDPGAVEAALGHLKEEFSFPERDIASSEVNGRRYERGRFLHDELCAGCHPPADPDPEIQLPAPNLFRLVRERPKEEVAARLIAGLRGTPETALDNPFPDEDLRALAVFYRLGP